MRVLVCGNRKWDDRLPIYHVLEGLYWHWRALGERMTVIEGGAKGADGIAFDWVNHEFEAQVDHEQYPADWNTHGGYAGPLRNQQMLVEGKPDVVWAFSDDIQQSKGTLDMCTRAAAAGVPVYVVSRFREVTPGITNVS